MEIRAWMQMAAERRETRIEISDQEMESLEEWVRERPRNSLERALWRYVEDWLSTQYGYGWEGGGEGEDLSANEGMPDGVLAVTSESSVPNTVRIRLDCPVCRARRS